MSLGKVARKLKRVGKTACQFRFTSSFEYIDVDCEGTWRPDKLSVIWLRNHRRVQSIDVKWVPTEDRGPNGAEGRAIFDPPLSIALIITLYRDSTGTEFEDKEYKYYVESDGPSGKKILASFNCNMAEYAGIPSTRHTLDMTFKTVSKKISKAVLGITLESDFIKQGSAMDDDMQSTFSAMSSGHDSMTFDDEEDDEEEEGRKMPSSPRLSKVLEESEPGPETGSLVTLGTGEMLKRGTLPYGAPPKPPRNSSSKSSFRLPEETQVDSQSGVSNVLVNGVTATTNHNAASVTVQVGANGLSSEVQVSQQPTPDIVITGSVTDATSQASPSLPPPPLPPPPLPPLPPPPLPPPPPPPLSPPPPPSPPLSPSPPPLSPPPSSTTPSPQQNESKSEQTVGEDAQLDTDRGHQNALRVATGSTTIEEDAVVVGGESEEKGATGSENHSSVKLSGEQESEKSMEMTSSMALVKRAEGFIKQMEKSEPLDSTPISMRAAEMTPADSKATELPSSHEVNGEEDGKLTGVEGERQPSRVVESGQQKEGVVQSGGHSEQESAGGNVEEENDFWFEAAQILAAQVKASKQANSPSSAPKRVTIQSKETYVPPPNPYLDDELANGAEEEPPPPSPVAAWLGDALLVDCLGELVGREKLDRAEIIGLYFSASWCPPCRRFLPKLVKFYHHLKQHGKSFEILYISSDYSKQDMMKYMQEQKMPWVGLAFESSVADKLRTDFSVSAIPLFTVVTPSGARIEESAKKSVESATGSAALKLYNRWHEKVEEGESEGVQGEDEQKKKKEKRSSRSEESQAELDKQKASRQTNGTVRQVVETKQAKSRAKSHVTLEQFEEKEKRVQHLEEVNISLKQTNDDLNEELAELRKQLGDLRQKLDVMEQSSRQLEDEKRELLANLNIRGWLCKRGLKGPTAHVWRRRYFRCDQGSKIYYYKSASEGTPQGFIDLDRVISVQEVSAAQQDKNHATFLVQCDGRTYQLQAHDEATMRKWMGAIEYLTDWRKRHTNGAIP